jgi:peptidoglycan-associated lipoprotein
MKKSLFLASLLSLFLIGCSSTPIVDVSKPAGPSASDDEKDLDLASLRDPNNILV